MKSFWNEKIENKISFQKINENIKTTTCIIGGGLTGLTLRILFNERKQ